MNEPGGFSRCYGSTQMTNVETLVRKRSLAQRVDLQHITFDAPWVWLAAGWRDLWFAPAVSLCYGGTFAGLAATLSIGLFYYRLEALILPLSGGFLLIGPIAALGLYETSHRLETYGSVALVDISRAALGKAGRVSFFAAMLVFIYLVWVQIAFLLLMLFLGTSQLPPASEFIPTLLFTHRGLALLVAGTCAGGLLALLVFCVSVVSVPLLMLRKVDAVTAVKTSVAAVLMNPKPMLLWAGLIAGFMVLGLATLFVGLVVAFPLIGYATWHAFRDVVIPEPSGYL
jgi:uncharacterized membrane protein